MPPRRPTLTTAAPTMDWQLSPHLSFFEMTHTDHADLLEAQRIAATSPAILGKLHVSAHMLFEPLRVAWGKPIRVNSGYRTPEVNTRIRGSATSQHVKAEAIDMTTGTQEGNRALWDLARKLSREGKLRFGQLILEPTWIHISLGEPFRSNQGQVLTYDGRKYTVVESHTYKG